MALVPSHSISHPSIHPSNTAPSPDPSIQKNDRVETKKILEYTLLKRKSSTHPLPPEKKGNAPMRLIPEPTLEPKPVRKT